MSSAPLTHDIVGAHPQSSLSHVASDDVDIVKRAEKRRDRENRGESEERDNSPHFYACRRRVFECPVAVDGREAQQDDGEREAVGHCRCSVLSSQSFAPIDTYSMPERSSSGKSRGMVPRR